MLRLIHRMLSLTKKQPSFFVIMSSPRSGSNYLCSMLSSHPNVYCHNEIFHHKTTGICLPRLSKYDLLFDKEWRDKNQHQFLDRMHKKTKSFSFRLKMIGCKLLLNEVQIRNGFEAILDFHPTIIFLHRLNKLAWYASRQIAGETGIWVNSKSSTYQHKITFKEKEFLSLLAEVNHFEQTILNQLNERNIKFMQLAYENLIQKQTQTMIMDYLNLSKKQLTAKTVKQNSEYTLNRFKNPGEVKAFAASINQLSWL